MTSADQLARAPAPTRPTIPGRLTFNRPPRLRSSLSTAQIAIPAPPQAAQKPQSSLGGNLIVPLIAVFAMGGMFLIGMGSGQSNKTFIIIAAVALGIGSGLPTVWMFFDERRRFKRTSREQVEQYGRQLRNAAAELARLREEEQTLRVQADPPPEVLVRQATARSRRLFERRQSDDDFLALRLGVGLAPSLLEIRGRAEAGSQNDKIDPGFAQLVLDAQHLADQYSRVPDVPIRADLKMAGTAGLTGPYDAVAPFARAVLCQAAIHHSPDDLRIAAFLGQRPIEDWAWLKWLPHTRGMGGTSQLAWDGPGRQSLSRWLLDELTGRKRLLEDSNSSRDDPVGNALPWLLLFLDDLRLVHSDPSIRMALVDGPRLHVAILGLADHVGAVPAGARGVAVLDDRGTGLVTYTRVGPGEEPVQCLPDAIDPRQAETLARALAPMVVLDESPEGAAGDIPSRITFFEALDIPSIEDLDVAEAWTVHSTAGLLRTPLGPVAGGDLLWLDLKEQSQNGHGPHGLVAGTTGAGKSELLLTVIAGLALRHPPDVLNFVLVDYKGGDAFQSVASLPHTVALITDLDRHLAARALLTLRSEIKRREHRLLELRSAGVTSLADYQLRRGDGEPMPYLLIVVDEFARLKDDLPEFINGLIDVARVGRSLGVHLILATQTPSGTVDDQIQKNTNFGLCLRVRDQSDSKQVIGEPDAALLPGSLPGRAYFRTGLDPARLFQTARVGAAYEARSTTSVFDVRPFEPLASRDDLEPGYVAPPASLAIPRHQTTEVRALTARLREASQTLGNAAVPWPAPLPAVIALVGDRAAADTPAEDGAPLCLWTMPSAEAWHWPTPAESPDWLAPPIGIVDEPTQQVQRPFRLDISRNCIVYGAPGSGKSTLLRSLATSLALSHGPADLHIFCLDFDARTLAPLAGLPHCGETGVFFPRDTVRIRRLFRMLEHELAERREAGVTNLRQQRRAGDARLARFPFIVVLLDNFAAFRETFEEEETLTRSMESMVADLATLMRDGPAAGIHFVLTTSGSGGLTNAVVNAAETRVSLRQNDAMDYGLVGRMDNLPEHLPAGRGFAPGAPPREFQVALLPDELEQASAEYALGLGLAGATARTADVFARLCQAAGDVRPPAVHDLPVWLSIDDERLGVPQPRLRPDSVPLVLGLDDERFRALVIDLTEMLHLVIAGPPGSGKTSLLLACIMQSLGTGARLYLTIPRASALGELARLAAGSARNVMQLGQLLDELEQVIDQRREALRADSADDAAAGGSSEPLLLVVDDYELLRQDDDFYDVESRLARLARRGTAVGLHVLLAGSNVELRDARDDLLRYLTGLRVGVLLQPDIELDGDLFNVRLRRLIEPPPVGRGYFILRQQQSFFQAVTPQLQGISLAESVRTRMAGARGLST